jgi:hypothetical protein
MRAADSASVRWDTPLLGYAFEWLVNTASPGESIISGV